MNRKRKIILVTMIIAAIALTLSSCVSRAKANEGPSAVVNIYPAQSAVVDENYFYSKWTQSTDPEGGQITYKINYAQTMDGLEDPSFYETVETYFLLPNLEEGIWYWRVTAIDNAGNSTKSPTWSFTINGETLPQPVDPEEIPADPALIVSEVENTSFTLDWPEYEDRQNLSQEIEYIIYVYDQGNAVNTRSEKMGQWMARTAPATTAHTTDTSHTFNGMNSQTLYDWVIIAQNNASQTSVVGSSQVKTGNRAPTQPTLLTPSEGATDVATDVTLNWSESTDPDGDNFKYYVYIDIVKNTNRNVTVEGIEETEYAPEGLEEGRTYYWFIMIKDENGAATRTLTQTFMAYADGMSVAASPTPADGSEGIDATAPPLLQWEHDKNGEQIEYAVYMSANPKKIEKKTSGLTQKEYQIPGILEGNTKYYWQIEAKEIATDKTTLSGVWTFKTGTIEAPVQTSAITNVDGTQIELSYDKPMSDPTGKKDNYTVKKEQLARITSRGSRTANTKQTIATSKIEMKAGTTNIYVLTLESEIENGDKVTIDYTPGTIASTDGGKLAKYTNTPVTNMVPGIAPIVEAATATVNTVEIAFDKDMKAVPTGAKIQFSVQSGNIIKQIESFTRTASDTYTLTLKTGQTISYGETVLISYSKGTVQGENEAYLESFAGIEAINTVPATVPQFVSGETTENGLTIKVTFDRKMADPTNKQTQFNLGINETQIIARRDITIESATLNTTDSKIVELGLSGALSNGQVVTLDYTAGDVKSADGAALATFTNKPITNRVPADLPICTAATMTEDGRSVEIRFSRDMRAPTTEETNQFGVLVNGYVNEIESATLSTDKRIITLNLQKPIGKNNEVHVSYTKGTVSSTNDGLLESFQNKKVNTDNLSAIWVIKGIGWNYSSINSAISGAEDGDTIMVAPGIYVENVQFGTKKVTLKSTYETDANAVNTTIIDGDNMGTTVVIGEYNIFTTGRKSQEHIPTLEGFTIRNGTVGAYSTTARLLMSAAGIYVTENAGIKYNIITQNGSETTGYNGTGIHVAGGISPVIHHNVISNNYNSSRGAGIYVEGIRESAQRVTKISGPQIYSNYIMNNKSVKGAGIYMGNGAIPLNAEGTSWKEFNAPNADILFVEDTTMASANTYSGNVKMQDDMSARSALSTEGADIYWNLTQTTPEGTLTLRPETEFEKSVITLNMDYTIGTEYHNGTVVFTLGDNNGAGFEITTGASVLINEEATAITNYTYNTKVATITGLKLEEGTITLRLVPQETPAGTISSIATRDLNYQMSAKGDADGGDRVWSQSQSSSQNFVAQELSVVTTFTLKEKNQQYIKKTESPTGLKVASETTIDTLLASIEASDESSQTYVIITSSGTQTGTDKLTESATLIVTAEYGNTERFAITINNTAFVKLESEASVSSGGRLSSRGAEPAEADISWHETITSAVEDASDFSQSTITVWPGHYIENLDLGNKYIHLMSTDPASQTVRETTIIDGNNNGTAIMVGRNVSISTRDMNYETIVEGFTVKRGAAVINMVSSQSRPSIDFSTVFAAGIYINRVDAVVQNNILTENGTGTGQSTDLSGVGIAVEGASPTITNNLITNNYTVLGGAGIGVINGSPVITNNTITGNRTTVGGYGAGIAVIDSQFLLPGSSARLSDIEIFRPVIYSNTITNNAAGKAPGILFYYMAQPVNAEGKTWKTFSSPEAEVTFVENTTTKNNTYSGNIILGTAITDGNNIAYGSDNTPEGTLTLRPEEGYEQSDIILNVDYLIGREFHGGSITVDVPDGFEITAGASVIIDGVATPASNYTQQQILINGINLEEGTVTLRLANQEIPTGVFVTSSSRDLGYSFRAWADADGAGSAWRTTQNQETADFTSKNLSLNTDFVLTGANPEYIQYKTTTPATELKVASETTVDTLLASIRVSGDSSQTYAIITASGTQTGIDKLTEAATLIVTAEHGNTYNYAIAINPTKFVELQSSRILNSGRQTGRPLPMAEYTWYDTIQEAVNSAYTSSQSTITVWPGVYLENVTIEGKTIHLMSTDPTSQTVRETTIIDAGYEGNVVKVYEDIASSARSESPNTIIEGFTIRNAGIPSQISATRLSDLAAGIYLSGKAAVIRNNLITENGTATGSRSGYGIYVRSSNSEIYSNTISKNWNAQGDGAGIRVLYSNTNIYDNVIDSNYTAYNGAGIVIGNTFMGIITTARPAYAEHATIYGNMISNNRAEKGAGVYVYETARTLNKENFEWVRFHAPTATITFVEHNTNAADNNTYSSNVLQSVSVSFRTMNEEGKDICFAGTETSTAGVLQLAPATATGTDGEKITLKATYTITDYTYEGSVTINLPDEMIVTTSSSITVNGTKRALTVEEIKDSGHSVTIEGVYTSGNQAIVLDFTHSSALSQGDYGLTAAVDCDGDGSRYSMSDLSAATLTIPSVGKVSFKQGGTQAAYDTIGEAVAAISGSESVTITLNESLYEISSSVVLNTVTVPVTFKAANNVSPIIDAQNRSQLFKLTDSSTVTFRGITFKNGYLSAGYGGAIQSNDTSMNLYDCSFVSNLSFTSFAAYGGALYAVTTSTANINISHCEFASNTVSYRPRNSAGGAAFIRGFDSVRIESSTFTANEARYGGAINFYDVNKIEIAACTFESNKALSGGSGGAVFDTQVSVDETVTITNSLFENNAADREGGAIWFRRSNNVEITSATLTNNTAADGSGIYLVKQSGCSPEITTNGHVWKESGSSISSTVDGDFSVDANGALDLNCDETDPVVVKGTGSRYFIEQES